MIKPDLSPELRRASAADAHALAPLYAAFYREDAITPDPDALPGNIARMADDRRAAIWIAERDGAILGFSAATLTFGVEYGWSAEIEDLYVIPDARGQGLARHLLNRAMTWAEAEGAKEILLVITPEAETDQGLSTLYARFGFTDTGRLLMSRSVRPGASAKTAG